MARSCTPPPLTQSLKRNDQKILTQQDTHRDHLGEPLKVGKTYFVGRSRHLKAVSTHKAIQNTSQPSTKTPLTRFMEIKTPSSYATTQTDGGWFLDVDTLTWKKRQTTTPMFSAYYPPLAMLPPPPVYTTNGWPVAYQQMTLPPEAVEYQTQKDLCAALSGSTFSGHFAVVAGPRELSLIGEHGVMDLARQISKESGLVFWMDYPAQRMAYSNGYKLWFRCLCKMGCGGSVGIGACSVPGHSPWLTGLRVTVEVLHNL